jgi:hypothetical protein
VLARRHNGLRREGTTTVLACEIASGPMLIPCSKDHPTVNNSWLPTNSATMKCPTVVLVNRYWRVCKVVGRSC